MSGVTLNPEIQNGVPCIFGTRIPIAAIKRCRRGGWGVPRIQKEFPSLTGEQIVMALAYEMPKSPPARLPQDVRTSDLAESCARLVRMGHAEAVPYLYAAWDMGYTCSMRERP